MHENENAAHPGGTDSAKVIQVIEVRSVRGDGREQPYRVVTEYWSLDGRKLAELDPTYSQVDVQS